MNGWQTAYGYAGGDFRDRFVACGGELEPRARAGGRDVHGRRVSTRCSTGSSDEFDGFMELDEVAWRELQEGRPEETKRILLGPELQPLRGDGRDRRGARGLPGRRRPTPTEHAFDDARDEARRRLIAVALGAGVVILLLLVTANDIARHGARGRAPRPRRREPPESERRDVVTQDVLLTLSLLLGAALAARFIASLLRVPEILLLVAFGALLGPSAARRRRRPVRLDRRPAHVHARRLADPVLRRAQPFARRPAAGLGGPRDARRSRGGARRRPITGVVAHFAFDLSWTAALLMGAVLAPTDPAILIPLFIRSRLRPKLAQTLVAESAFNDPTGAVLALALAGVLAHRRGLDRDAGRASSWSTSRSAQ